MPLLISGGPALRVVPRGYDHAGYAQGVRQVRHTCVIADQERGAAQEGRQAAKVGASGQVHDDIRKLRGDRGGQAGFGGRAGQRDWQPASGKPTCHLDEIPERPAARGVLAPTCTQTYRPGCNRRASGCSRVAGNLQAGEEIPGGCLAREHPGIRPGSAGDRSRGRDRGRARNAQDRGSTHRAPENRR